MHDWELGLIIGCSVLSVILIALALRYVCRSRGDNGETKPLLKDSHTQSSTAKALRFDTHINVDGNNQQSKSQSGQQHHHHGADSGFLDVAATRRIHQWIDEVEKARKASDGLVPLGPGVGSPGSSAASGGGGIEASQLLGDTPDVAGVVTPRTPNSLSPRISGMDDGSSSGVVLGYSPKMNLNAGAH